MRIKKYSLMSIIAGAALMGTAFANSDEVSIPGSVPASPVIQSQANPSITEDADGDVFYDAEESENEIDLSEVDLGNPDHVGIEMTDLANNQPSQPQTSQTPDHVVIDMEPVLQAAQGIANSTHSSEMADDYAGGVFPEDRRRERGWDWQTIKSIFSLSELKNITPQGVLMYTTYAIAIGGAVGLDMTVGWTHYLREIVRYNSLPLMAALVGTEPVMAAFNVATAQ
jgi:hypothetical protein